MLYKENGELKLADEKILFERAGIAQEQIVVEGKEWWSNFEKQWDDMSILGFEDIVYTPEQLLRFEEIRHLAICENILNDYVMDGIIGEGLKMLELEKENKRLQGLMADLAENVLLGGAI